METDKKVAIGLVIAGIFFVIGSLGGYSSYKQDEKKAQEVAVILATVTNVKECKTIEDSVALTDENGNILKDHLGKNRVKTTYRTECSIDYTYTYNDKSYSDSGVEERQISAGEMFSIGVNKNDPSKREFIPVAQEHTTGGLIFLFVLGIIFIAGGVFVLKRDS
ncbi:MAG: DUF3592 domain-containing protein [Proteobacteria bacterium]|nr:DUF3592 domain-containing protein [Pseudomonadota bacterium]